MTYFTPDYLQFFKELKENNTKEWFHSQKKRYEQSVKEPFKAFVAALISEVNKQDPNVMIEPKDAISRINRDIRFAKDKTPYNLNLNAFISPKGKRDKSIPGLFVRLAEDRVGIMGGCYGMEKGQLVNMREQLMEDPSEFKKRIQHKDFTSKFGEIQGEKMKRIPKEYKAAAEVEPLILNKQFYFMTTEDTSLIHSEKLMETVMDHYQAMKPVNDYLFHVISRK